MASPEVIEPLIQKDGGDCSIAVLAMFLGRSYREISEVALKTFTSFRPHSEGLSLVQIRSLARKFGVTLASTHPKKVDLNDHTGILSVSHPDKEGHVVLLFQGIIIDPADGLVYSLDAFQAFTGRKFTRLLY